MSKSRSVNSTKNLTSGLLNKTLNSIISFILKTVFIKVFGVEILGINGLFTNVISFLCLADLGFGTAMTYSYYKPVAENDYVKLAALNHFYRKVYNVVALIVGVIGVVLIPFLKYIINMEHEVDHLYLYYVLTLSNVVVSYLFAYKSTIINAHQENYLIMKFYMIVETVSMIILIAAMLLFKNYIVYLCLTIFFSFFKNVYVAHMADKRYPFIKQKAALSKDEKHGIFANLKSVFIYKVSSVLINSTDNILISKLIGTIIVGYYSNYLTIINMISSYVGITFTSLTASIGNLMAKESERKKNDIFNDLQVVSAWFCIVIATCVYALLNDFVVIWIGKEFLLDNLTVMAIAVNFFLICLLQPIWVYREAAGVYQKTKYIMLLCAILNIVYSIVLGKLIGLSGILFASALAKLSSYIWYEPIVLFRDYFRQSAKKYFESILFICCVTAAVGTGLKYLVPVVPIDGILGFIVKGVICFSIANIVYLLIYGRNKSFRDVIARIVSLVTSKIAFLNRIGFIEKLKKTP